MQNSTSDADCTLQTAVAVATNFCNGTSAAQLLFSSDFGLAWQVFAGWCTVVEPVALKTFLGVIMNVYLIRLSRTLAGRDPKLQLEFTTVLPRGT